MPEYTVVALGLYNWLKAVSVDTAKTFGLLKSGI